MIDRGLIRGQILNGQGGSRVVDWDGISGWKESDGDLWLHLDYSDEQPHPWMSEHAGIEPLIVEFLYAEDTRPRCTHFSTARGDGLMLSLRGINHNPGADPEDMVAVRIWIEQHIVITSRRRKLQVTEEIFRKLDAGDGPQDVSELLVAISQQLMLGVGEALTELDERMDTLEESALSQPDQTLRRTILELRREMIQLRRYMAPQREALSRMVTEKLSWFPDEDRRRLREVTDHVTRHVEDLDAIKDRCSVAYEELTGRIAEESNQRMYILSIVAAIFLPLGFFTGLLGINIGGIPGAEDPSAFGIFMMLMVLVVIGQLTLFRWRRWL